MRTASSPSPSFDDDYRKMLRTLSEGSVHVHFDPYDDVDWDAPEMAFDAKDPRWILPAHLDPLGATALVPVAPRRAADRARPVAHPQRDQGGRGL